MIVRVRIPRSMTPENKTTICRGRLPDFLVVGSIKCGTTSLHHYLSLHPEVHVSRPKELDFFIGPKSDAAGMPAEGAAPSPPWANWWRGEEWYRGHFVTTRSVCGEISPAYVDDRWIREATGRMQKLVPAAKLILLVRQPLERLRSHYLMLLCDGRIDSIPFPAFVEAADFVCYRRFSHYGTQLKRMLEHFPRESILVVESAALDRDRTRTLAEIFTFLGVDPAFRTPAFRRRLFEGRRRRFPSALGAKVLRLSSLVSAERMLPFSLYEVVRNAALLPFTAPPPPVDLPLAMELQLREEFRAEVALARQLSGLSLESLDV